MLKLHFLIISAIMFPSWSPVSSSLLLLSFFMMFKLYFHLPLLWVPSPYLCLDSLSVMLIFLSLWVTLLMFIASWKINEKKKHKSYLSSLMMILLLILILAFSISNLISFYILFEASLLPTMLIIMGWGYQPERLNASIYLLLYTVTASLPLLCMLSWIYFNLNSLFLLNMSLSTPLHFSYSSSLMLTLAFLVKMPMFISHLWLPKAHVEAPVAGSMILAGVLLKLGAYGIIRILILQKNIMASISPMIMCISLWGAAVTSFICMRQHDMKSLIAYSSVGHMALVIMGMMFSYKWGWEGAAMMLFAHGLVSSGLFAITNSYYEITNTRSLFLTKGMSSLFPLMSMWWFLLCIANMGAPPSLNLFSEIMLLISIISSTFWSTFFMGISMFLAAAYSLILFTSLHHGSLLPSSHPLTLPLSRNSLISLFHLIPVFILFLTPLIISSFLF